MDGQIISLEARPHDIQHLDTLLEDFEGIVLGNKAFLDVRSYLFQKGLSSNSLVGTSDGKPCGVVPTSQKSDRFFVHP